METERLDTIRHSVLDRMERAERGVRLAIFGAALAELALLSVAFVMVNWDNHLERLLFVLAVLSYTILASIQQPLFRYVSTLLRDDDASADVLQEVLLVISRRLPSLRDPRWFRAWAYRIATREAVRQARCTPASAAGCGF